MIAAWHSRRVAACAALVAGLGATSSARAYEFEVSAHSIGQGLDLRIIRPVSGNTSVSVRRFTQTLSLHIWNLGDDTNLDYNPYRSRRKGPQLSVRSDLRIDHDFGDFTSAAVRTGATVRDAVDWVPELENQSLALDVLTLYFAAEELLDGRLDVLVGRQLEVSALEWWSFDGVRATVRPTPGLALGAFAGLRVRDTSLLASSTTELDGTGSGQCREYVEGAVAGSGAWRPIDLGIPDLRAFRSDYDLCPQREELMPTVGGQVTASLGRWWRTRVEYRRSMSPSPGLLGAVDRLPSDDLGFYPNEDGQAPDWGVNEEKLTLSARGALRSRDGTVRADPHLAVRYSFLHGLIDEVLVGGRLTRGAHAIEPEVFYSFPTFDGDSIFNVFSVQPYWDLRVTYTRWALERRLSVFARPWARRFSVEDADIAAEPVDSSSWAGGGQAGARYRFGLADLVGVDAFWEDGYGGRRAGGAGLLGWQLSTNLHVGTRLSAIEFEAPLWSGSGGVNVGAQLMATYVFWDGVAFRVMSEGNHNPLYGDRARVIAILDLAFRPEL